jgi:hypothetical protein
MPIVIFSVKVPSAGSEAAPVSSVVVKLGGLLSGTSSPVTAVTPGDTTSPARTASSTL